MPCKKKAVAKLCVELPAHHKYKLFFDNWFTTLALMHYLKEKGILAVGTIRANRVQNCLLENSKSLAKSGRGSLDYKVDRNSGLIIVKWVDNSVAQLDSNYVGIEPMSTVTRWSKKDKADKDIPCPQIIKQYNASMGGVDLADMLIAIYRIPCRTKRWYLKVFWHLVDMCEVNAWVLYKRHHQQLGLPNSTQLSLLEFTTELSESLIHANKVNPTTSLGRPPKRRSVEVLENPRRKPPVNPTPCDNIRYDMVSHWPMPTDGKKNRCGVCKMTCRMSCEKCKVFLCLQDNRNCFKDFHTKR